MARKNTEKPTGTVRKDTETSTAMTTKKGRRLQGEIKQQMKRKVTAVLISTVALFVVFFVPSAITTPVAKGLNEWHKLLIKFGIAVPVMVFVPWIIFAQDQLATGASKASQFFRHHYPSALAVKKYSMSRQEADRVWFEYFNAWEDPKHRWHNDYKNTFERGYSLRLIYYLNRLLLLFVIAASVATTLSAWLLDEPRSVLAPKIVLIAIAGLLWWWVHASNTFTKLASGEYSATGAYFKYQEMNGITSNRFEVEVLAKRKATVASAEMIEGTEESKTSSTKERT
jgi:hypothetical protein